MSNYIRFQDTVQFKAIEAPGPVKKDNLSMQVQGNNRPLIVKIAATHAGIITRNNGFYLPDRMKKGAASFTAHYGKPVQVHHNQDADPVGRVLKAEYVDISGQVRDTYLKKFSDKYMDISDNLTKFMDGKMAFIESVNFICDELNTQNSILEDPNYPGLGYIQLTAVISDPEAAQKIMDGRYLTGSVGVSTNKAVCSVCTTDWTDSGKCEHRPGKNYDGKKAFLITGDLTYDEYSFVNVPADRHSRVLEVNVNGITDSLEMDESLGHDFITSLDTTQIPEGIEIRDYLSTMDSTVQEGTEVMAETEVTKLVAPLKDKYTKYINEEGFAAIITSLETLKDMEEHELEVRVEEALDKAAISNVFTLAPEARLDALKEIRSFMDPAAIENVLKDKLETEDAFYQALNHAEWLDYSEEEDEELTRYKLEHPEDSKLHAAARKRLPGSSFCGPNRSFPVPDCAHVTAARRLIGRAKASGATKSGILSCVSRKAKALSCDDSKKDNTVAQTVEDNTIVTPVVTIPEVVVAVIDPLKDLQDKFTQLTATFAELESKFKELTDSNEKLKVEHEKMISDHKIMLETYTNKDAAELVAVRDELKLCMIDLTQMSDQLVTSQEKITSLQVARVLDYKKLSGEKIVDEVKLLDELNSKSSADLDVLLAETSTKVDMSKIADSINTGLTRTPVGSVTDPTAGLASSTKIIDRKIVEQIADEYMRIKLGGKSNYGTGREGAERFKADMQKQGLLPTG